MMCWIYTHSLLMVYESYEGKLNHFSFSSFIYSVGWLYLSGFTKLRKSSII